MPGPLDGVRIIDFSQVVAGPFAATFLADQGADIIKVEPVTGAGDMTRGLPSYVKNGFPALMINNNRGKRCIALDLTTEEGRSIGLELCEGADVVLQNFRPGAMGRLGLDYDSVAAVNPKIIYCSISGFGPDGPYSDRPVLDPVIQGLTGIVDRQVGTVVLLPQIPVGLAQALLGQRLAALGQRVRHCLPLVEEDLSHKGVGDTDRKSTRLNSSHSQQSRMPSSA